MQYEDLPRDEKTKVLLVEQVEFPISYRLLTPISKDGVSCGELVIREPKVVDLEISNKEGTDIGRSIALLSDLLELTKDEVRSMGTRDFARLSNTVTAFL